MKKKQEQMTRYPDLIIVKSLIISYNGKRQSEMRNVFSHLIYQLKPVVKMEISLSGPENTFIWKRDSSGWDRKRTLAVKSAVPRLTQTSITAPIVEKQLISTHHLPVKYPSPVRCSSCGFWDPGGNNCHYSHDQVPELSGHRFFTVKYHNRNLTVWGLLAGSIPGHAWYLHSSSALSLYHHGYDDRNNSGSLCDEIWSFGLFQSVII